jgi:hypothetical protein
VDDRGRRIHRPRSGLDINGVGTMKKNAKKSEIAQTKIESSEEITAVANEMYKKCYIGHIPWPQWLCFAQYCIEYAERKNRITMIGGQRVFPTGFVPASSTTSTSEGAEYAGQEERPGGPPQWQVDVVRKKIKNGN